jgi:CDP-diacylglycerol--glycerol-3-phosphate 3-phosphatidyltransferase
MFALGRGRFWTIPNALSLSRLALLPVWWLVMSSANRTMWWWGGVLLVYGMISDVLDGYIARRFNQASEWGRILDPLGDKIAAGVIAIFCVAHRDMPMAALLLMIGRDLFLVVAGWAVLRKSGEVPASINMGRFAALFWAITLLLYSFDWQPYGRYILWPVVGFYLLAGLAYLMRRKRLIAG